MKWKDSCRVVMILLAVVAVVCCFAPCVDARDVIVINQVADGSALNATPARMMTMQMTSQPASQEYRQVKMRVPKARYRISSTPAVRLNTMNAVGYQSNYSNQYGATNVAAGMCNCGPDCPCRKQGYPSATPSATLTTAPDTYASPPNPSPRTDN